MPPVDGPNRKTQPFCDLQSQGSGPPPRLHRSLARYRITDENRVTAAGRESEDCKPRDLAAVRKFLASDFEEVYAAMEQEEKRQLWRSIIDHLVVEGNRVVDVVFKT